MKYVDTSKPVDIPTSVVSCPDCHGGLWVEITEYAEDGEITEGGFDIHCDNENADYDLHAERWQNDWIPVSAKVYNWLLDNVRAAEATEDDLKAWREAVKDWD